MDRSEPCTYQFAFILWLEHHHVSRCAHIELTYKSNTEVTEHGTITIHTIFHTNISGQWKRHNDSITNLQYTLAANSHTQLSLTPNLPHSAALCTAVWFNTRPALCPVASLASRHCNHLHRYSEAHQPPTVAVEDLLMGCVLVMSHCSAVPVTSGLTIFLHCS